PLSVTVTVVSCSTACAEPDQANAIASASAPTTLRMMPPTRTRGSGFLPPPRGNTGYQPQHPIIVKAILRPLLKEEPTYRIYSTVAFLSQDSTRLLVKASPLGVCDKRVYTITRRAMSAHPRVSLNRASRCRPLRLITMTRTVHCLPERNA